LQAIDGALLAFEEKIKNKDVENVIKDAQVGSRAANKLMDIKATYRKKALQ
jgi:hypothetical protein